MDNKNKILFIAEAGVNHNGDINKALELVDVAAESGADIIKFQYYKTESLLQVDTPKSTYQLSNTSILESQFEMLKKLELDSCDLKKIINRCVVKGIEFLATPFDENSLDELIDYGIKRIKIPSGEITNGPLILKSALSNLPIILSTGMSHLSEIEDALGLIAHGRTNQDTKISSSNIKNILYTDNFYSNLNDNVTVLHCTSQYPAPLNSINLNAMQEISNKFNVPVGYSDHTEGSAIAIASAALGAQIIEKHFTLDRSLPGPDHKASLEPKELFSLVSDIRSIQLALGGNEKILFDCEKENRVIARKSLTARCEIKKGAIFSKENLIALRPGNGISPMNYWDILGSRAEKDFKTGETIII
ncbi:MAG: N-acetylneuraminate synthase [Rhodospirillaceae bacterium]|nr:N-acetylneuraminate synthase [Rhodospirillaceae bacterium]